MGMKWNSAGSTMWSDRQPDGVRYRVALAANGKWSASASGPARVVTRFEVAETRAEAVALCEMWAAESTATQAAAQ